jgi:hypothetical protein
MRSTAKTILFSRVKHGNQVRQWPVAVFNSAAQAKSHVGLIKLAYTSANVDMARNLDKRTPITEDGKLQTLPEFSVVVIPYNPVPGMDDGEDLKDESEVTV